MNTRQVIDESVGPYSLSTTFNSDNSCFSIGLDTGFCGRNHLPRALLFLYEDMDQPWPTELTVQLPVFNADPCELKVSRGAQISV